MLSRLLQREYEVMCLPGTNPLKRIKSAGAVSKQQGSFCAEETKGHCLYNKGLCHFITLMLLSESSGLSDKVVIWAMSDKEKML